MARTSSAGDLHSMTPPAGGAAVREGGAGGGHGADMLRVVRGADVRDTIHDPGAVRQPLADVEAGNASMDRCELAADFRRCVGFGFEGTSCLLGLLRTAGFQ